MRYIILSGILLAFSIPAAAMDFFTIGTGSVTGTYYPTGGALCRLVNKHKKETELHCSVESTGGSVYNVNSIRGGDMDFGIVQSDVAYQAHHGTLQFKDAPFAPLRSVMAIHPELLSLVVNQKAGINQLGDIRGKRINIGNPGSGNEATAMLLMEEAGLSQDDLDLAGVLTAQECPNALRDNKIDGYFYMVGHPTANIKDAANSVAIDIVPLKGPAIDRLLKKHSFYSEGIIHGGEYNGVEDDVPTFGVKAVLVTRADMADDRVSLLVKSVLDNFEDFKSLHPAYKHLTKENLVKGGGIPLHPAAEAIYRQAGLLK